MIEQGSRIRFVAIAIAVLGPCLPVLASPTGDSVAIVSSGSTNRAGYRIMVERSGSAEYTAVPRRSGPQSKTQSDTPARRRVPDALVKRFFSDLETAKPLTSLPQPRCAKSASFGSRLTIEAAGFETPDLSCGDGDSPKLRALIRDANEIVALFGAQ